jgi:hypothetical protein
MTTTRTPTADRRPPTTADPRRDRAFVAGLLLTTAGVMITDRLTDWPLGNALLLLLGLELLVWAVTARHAGPLIPGALLAGLGSAAVLVAGPLEAAAPGVPGGTVLAGFALGFLLIAVLGGPVAGHPQRWSWIPAVACAAVAAGLFADVARVAALASAWWLAPVVLATVAGVLLLPRRVR